MIMSASWNPWHGCTKISAGCKYCYVYRQDEMYGADTSSREVRKTANFSLPVKLKRDKSYKIESENWFIPVLLLTSLWMVQTNGGQKHGL